jgi:hypothetical protein
MSERTLTPPRRTTSTFRWREPLRWMATFAGFPIGGYLGHLLGGPVDDVPAALLGGAITGAVVGAAQAWGLRLRTAAVVGWVAATAVGFAVGLAAGAAAVGYDTTLADLALQGAITGLGVGIAQGICLRRSRRSSTVVTLVWPVAVSALWALGWVITTAAGISVEKQFTVFGSSGALVVTALTVLTPSLLHSAHRNAS